MAWEIIIFLVAELLIAAYFSYKIEGRITEARTLRYIVLLMIFTFIITFAIAFYNEPLFSFIGEKPIAAPFVIGILSILIVAIYIAGSKLGAFIRKTKNRKL